MCNPSPNGDEHLRQVNAELYQMIEEIKQDLEGIKDVEQYLRDIQEARQYELDEDSDQRKNLIRNEVRRMRSLILESGEFKMTSNDFDQEAYLKTMKWFAIHFHEFDPNKTATVIGWFKGHFFLNRKMCKRDEIQRNQRSDDALFEKDKAGKKKPKEEIMSELQADPEAEIRQLNILRECIEQCDCCRRRRMREQPEVDFQKLLLHILPRWDHSNQEWIPGSRWEELARQFGLPKQRLINWYKTCLRNTECLNALKICLEENGFEDD